MNNTFAIAEYKQDNGSIEWKITYVDCTPMIDMGVTDEENLQDWAIEKNCTKGYVLHNFNFFADEEKANAWVNENMWY